MFYIFDMHMIVNVLKCVGTHVYVSVCACGGLEIDIRDFPTSILFMKGWFSLYAQLTDEGSVASQFALGKIQCTGVIGRCHACLPFT